MLYILESEEKPKWRLGNLIKATFRDFIVHDIFVRRTGDDPVSSNAKVVLYTLFLLIGLSILLYTITVLGFDDPDNMGDSERVQRLERLDQINAVFLAAISGSLALGGTLIAQIWGRTKKP
jgi:hypothetical protein